MGSDFDIKDTDTGKHYKSSVAPCLYCRTKIWTKNYIAIEVRLTLVTFTIDILLRASLSVLERKRFLPQAEVVIYSSEPPREQIKATTNTAQCRSPTAEAI